MNSPFYIVLAENDKFCQHTERYEAAQEAERLALKHPGEKFFVLGVLGLTQKSKTTTEVFQPEPYSDIPF